MLGDLTPLAFSCRNPDDPRRTPAGVIRGERVRKKEEAEECKATVSKSDALQRVIEWNARYRQGLGLQVDDLEVAVGGQVLFFVPAYEILPTRVDRVAADNWRTLT